MNVLGGYQKINISTADLTASTLSVEGLSKACANANGKAVLVKMPDGTEAFGAVKEASGGYQLSVMGADSKVSTITVDDTDDSFTMAESDSVTGEEYLAAPVNISDATYQSPYTAPFDGIVRIQNISTSNLASSPAVMVAARNSNIAIMNLPTASTAYPRTLSCFVKKGTVIYGSNIVSDVNITFDPYKAVE